MGVARRHRAGVGEDAAVTAERILLLSRWRAGDAAAGALLMQAYFTMVDAAAARWRRNGIQKSDLVQEGRLGLVEALRRYDATSAAPLTAYVSKWIEGRIKQHVMDFSGPVRMTDAEARRRFFADPEGRPATVEMDDDIASAGPDPEDLAIARLLEEHRRDIVGRCLEMLSERERDVIRRRALAETPQKLADIAAERGVTRQTVHGLEARSMEKMREAVSGLFGMRIEWLV